MNTKPIPILITLLAAVISCFISVLQGVDFPTFLGRLLLTVFLFYIIGIVVGILIYNAFPPPPKEETQETGEGDLGDEGVLKAQESADGSEPENKDDELSDEAGGEDAPPVEEGSGDEGENTFDGFGGEEAVSDGFSEESSDDIDAGDDGKPEEMTPQSGDILEESGDEEADN